MRQIIRPRLSERVRVRIHRAALDDDAGASDMVVVLHVEGAEAAQVGRREWMLLSCCDGTRDLEGIRLAARQRGTRASLEQVAAFVEQLDAAGWLEEGPARPPETEAGGDAPARPIVSLPGFTLRCDGRGSCCRFFATMLFRPEEVLRARLTAPERADAGRHPRSMFSPERGSVDAPWMASAVSTVAGRCSYLDEDLGCALHRRGGPDAKPLGCRVFPAVLVDQGQAVRVGPRPECACVFRSARDQASRPGSLPGLEAPSLAAPWLAAPSLAAGRTDALDPGVVVTTLAETIPVAANGWSRARYLDWAAARQLELTAAMDGAAWLDAAAARLGGEAADEDAELQARVERALEAAAWRDPADLFRQTLEGVGGRPARSDAEAEGFYLRAVAFSHLWALDGLDLAVSLRRRAAVLRLARRLRVDDVSGDEPIALAEALARRLGYLV